MPTWGKPEYSVNCSDSYNIKENGKQGKISYKVDCDTNIGTRTDTLHNTYFEGTLSKDRKNMDYGKVYKLEKNKKNKGCKTPVPDKNRCIIYKGELEFDNNKGTLYDTHGNKIYVGTLNKGYMHGNGIYFYHYKQPNKYPKIHFVGYFLKNKFKEGAVYGEEEVLDNNSEKKENNLHQYPLKVNGKEYSVYDKNVGSIFDDYMIKNLLSDKTKTDISQRGVLQYDGEVETDNLDYYDYDNNEKFETKYKLNGKGILYNPDGKTIKYKGLFEDNKFIEGLLYYPGKNVKYEGKFKDDKFIEGKFFDETGEYKGEYKDGNPVEILDASLQNPPISNNEPSARSSSSSSSFKTNFGGGKRTIKRQKHTKIKSKSKPKSKRKAGFKKSRTQK